MNFHEIRLMDLVSNTISGVEGVLLKNEIEANLRINQGVLVSFKGHGPLSTEFIRRSFGAMLERYGHEVFLRYIRITGTHMGIEDILCLGYEEVEDLGRMDQAA